MALNKVAVVVVVVAAAAALGCMMIPFVSMVALLVADIPAGSCCYYRYFFFRDRLPETPTPTRAGIMGELPPFDYFCMHFDRRR